MIRVLIVKGWREPPPQFGARSEQVLTNRSHLTADGYNRSGKVYFFASSSYSEP
jgi:hypothetical protein